MRLPCRLGDATPTSPIPPDFPVHGHLTLHPPADAQRDAVEQSIRDMYAQRYGALVPAFAPMLLALREGPHVLAAVGYRRADAGALFLEQYLPAPVETVLAGQTDRPVAREGIVEVGNLAAPRGGEGRRLVQLLGPYLIGEGFDWVVGTVTQELRVMLERLGVAPLMLGPAVPEVLGPQAQCWGSYYAHAPVVVAIHLRRALRQFMTRRARRAAGGRA